MTEPVVDVLEVVEIEEEHAEHAPGGPRMRQRLFDTFGEEGAVGEPCQGVV